jgi:hypothetical protein
VNVYIRPTHVRPYAGDTVQTDRGRESSDHSRARAAAVSFFSRSGTTATADIVVMRPVGRLQTGDSGRVEGRV